MVIHTCQCFNTWNGFIPLKIDVDSYDDEKSKEVLSSRKL